ncbi:sulfotransferase family protein [Minwuia sp.]|uniref:sulfotransferase family protein n=1 Tax=Minwuia sp. TaxID=2493630 RepID=UPI003A8D1663
MTPERIDFFIAGSERSGTTVTGTMLDQMPEICAVQATMVMTRLSNLYDMITRVVRQGGGIEGVDPALCGSLQEFATNVPVTPFLHKCLFHYSFYENLVFSSRSDVTKDVLSQKAYVEDFDFARYMARFEQGDRTWAASVAALYAEFAASAGSDGHIFGEQTPDNALRAEAISALYPQAKFIFMVRHPVTSIASLMDRYSDVDYATKQFRNPYAHFPFNNESVMERTLFVKFEDVLLNPLITMNSMREFLGLEALSEKAFSTEHKSKVFSQYVGGKLSMDRYYRSLTKYPIQFRAEILQKNEDIAKVFYSEGESRAILGYQEAA